MATVTKEAPKLFDIFALAESTKEVSGVLTLHDMPTLADALTGEKKEARAEFTLKATKGEKGLSAVELTLTAQMTTQCVYCGEPCRIPINKKMALLLAHSEEEADRFPIPEDGEFDIIVGSKRFNASDLVAEELILSLPNFPRHDACKATGTLKAETSEAKSENHPFSNLADLMKATKH